MSSGFLAGRQVHSPLQIKPDAHSLRLIRRAVRMVGEVTYSGEVLDGAMKGKVKYGDVGGTFTAKRADK